MLFKQGALPEGLQGRTTRLKPPGITTQLLHNLGRGKDNSILKERLRPQRNSKIGKGKTTLREMKHASLFSFLFHLFHLVWCCNEMCHTITPSHYNLAPKAPLLALEYISIFLLKKRELCCVVRNWTFASFQLEEMKMFRRVHH